MAELLVWVCIYVECKGGIDGLSKMIMAGDEGDKEVLEVLK